jgi:hypothetical protein
MLSPQGSVPFFAKVFPTESCRWTAPSCSWTAPSCSDPSSPDPARLSSTYPPTPPSHQCPPAASDTHPRTRSALSTAFITTITIITTISSPHNNNNNSSRRDSNSSITTSGVARCRRIRARWLNPLRARGNPPAASAPAALLLVPRPANTLRRRPIRRWSFTEPAEPAAPFTRCIPACHHRVQIIRGIPS